MEATLLWDAAVMASEILRLFGFLERIFIRRFDAKEDGAEILKGLQHRYALPEPGEPNSFPSLFQASTPVVQVCG